MTSSKSSSRRLPEMDVLTIARALSYKACTEIQISAAIMQLLEKRMCSILAHAKTDERWFCCFIVGRRRIGGSVLLFQVLMRRS
jgi:hypothetical protein